MRLGALGPARYAGSTPKRRPYPSDLSDARRELIEPVLTAWRLEHRGRTLALGRPHERELRDIMDAILYVDRTGVRWRYLPHDFPHWSTVCGYFSKWADEGVFAQLSGLLRQPLREKEGRDAEPAACVIDARSVKTSTSVPATGQGIDAGKKSVGRKRSIATYTLGLLLAVLVTAAGVQDSVAGTALHISIPQTTSPTLSYSAIESRIPIGGRVIAGARTAKFFEPSNGDKLTAIPGPLGPLIIRRTSSDPRLEGRTS